MNAIVCRLPLSALLVVCLTLLPSGAKADQPSLRVPVGQVLVNTGNPIGISPQNKQYSLRPGVQVFEGDRLRTDADERLQLKMKDGAILVLHPSTEVLLHTYRTQDEWPDAAAIRLELLHGTLRSLSGRTGQRAPDAFRLNTPIAAIGIRGTDFTTEARPERTRVALHSGAVIIAPLGASCAADALGPCDNSNSLLLDESRFRGAELRAGDTRPRGINHDFLPPPVPLGSENGNELSLLDNSIGSPDSEPSPPDHIDWGRWSSIDLPRVPTAAELMAQGKRHVFANDLFVLFRDGYQALGQGSVSFRLEHAQAYLMGDDRLTPVSISDGRLTVDFGAQRFDTQITAQTETPLSLLSAGRVTHQGYLLGESGNMAVKGLLSLDNQQAGYLFTYPLEDNASLQGATQWRKP